MPVNYLQIKSQIETFGLQAMQTETQRKLIIDEILSAMQNCRFTNDEINQLLEQELAQKRQSRCALPLETPFNRSIPGGEDQTPIVLFAADGSQVNPSRHDPVPFCLINVGSLRYEPGNAPKELVETQMLTHESIYSTRGMISEDDIAYQRDFQERVSLLVQAKKETKQTITLTDGPLELYQEPGSSQRYKAYIKQYKDLLGEMRANAIITAGYVDRPFSNLIVQLMQVLMEQDGKRISPPAGLIDLHIFSRLLKPGERSALFQILRREENPANSELQPVFFYLNVSNMDKPSIARVEIPLWVALDEQMVNLLHYHLLQQTRILASRPYPYLLHRAHETALVSLKEKTQLQELIQKEMIKHGFSPSESSNKQLHKDETGKKKRYSL